MFVGGVEIVVGIAHGDHETGNSSQALGEKGYGADGAAGGVKNRALAERFLKARFGEGKDGVGGRSNVRESGCVVDYFDMCSFGG